MFDKKASGVRKKKKSGVAQIRKTNSNKEIHGIKVSETSNDSAKDDDSSVEQGSNFSINKIKKMIDKKIRPGEDEMQRS